MSENTAGLGELISATVAKQLDAAFVEKEVETRVKKLVTDAVDSALRSYSDTGRTIEKAVSDALRVERLDLPSYGLTVAAILKEQIEARVSELVAGRLAQDMEELLGLAPKAVKLSEITEEMLKPHREEGSYGEVITAIIEHNEYGSTWISLDEETHHEGSRAEYQCRHRLLLSKDGTISSLTADSRDVKNTKHLGRSYGLGQKLRAYLACGTVITVDEDNVVTSVGDY